ncbi:MAG: trigger factor [Chloroflexota bacterium]
MKIDKTIRDDHQAELVVEIEAERMEAAKRRAARKLSERGKIPGFRPGKAPYEMVRRHYGDEPIVEQAIDLLVDEIYPEALKQAEVEPAAAGALEKIESADPPKFIFRVPLMPTVDLGDFEKIRKPYDWAAPGEVELDKALDDLRQMYGTTETVERAIQVGDYVLVDVKGEAEKAAEGEELDLSRDGVAVLVRKEDRDDEWPFPGFAHGLIGVKSGETKTVKHKFPKDFSDEKLQGKTIAYTATVKTVRGVTLPELNDDFAKMVGQNFETLEQLKDVVRKELEERSKADYDDEYFAELIDAIKAGATVKYPPQVLEHEGEHVIDDLRQRLASQNMDLETYLKVRNTTMEKFMEEEVRPVATKRLERGLIMDEIARHEKVEIDEAALGEEFNQTLNNLAVQNAVDFDRLNKSGRRTQERFSQLIANESAARLMARRTLERLKEIATGEAKPKAETAEGEDKPKKAAAASKSKKEAPPREKKAAARKSSAKKSR